MEHPNRDLMWVPFTFSRRFDAEKWKVQLEREENMNRSVRMRALEEHEVAGLLAAHKFNVLIPMRGRLCDFISRHLAVCVMPSLPGR